MGALDSSACHRVIVSRNVRHTATYVIIAPGLQQANDGLRRPDRDSKEDQIHGVGKRSEDGYHRRVSSSWKRHRLARGAGGAADRTDQSADRALETSYARSSLAPRAIEVSGSPPPPAGLYQRQR